MDCEAKGKIVEELEGRFGTLQNGNDWEKRVYVIEISQKYKQKMMFSMFSFDGPIQDPIEVGESVKINFIVEAHQYNGKWYNEVKVTRVEKV
ncbi:DUF3127 domain-containing protein [uncultured Bacteroides sp.]|uniref:DUF3127 domain-containing protein n=1 Tax=uncultured Bacteroides sp. TaxID=162156 RepID=UPI002AA86096|nr:DUF3127 domain-containing protein [uncultured Bacteroides sp.]